MSEIHGAVGAYVMNALDPSELDEFQAHLADCDTCQREVVELWTLAGPLTAPTRVTPDALVGGGNPVKQWFTGPVGQSDALAISIEKAGGAVAPTNIQGATAL